MERWWRALEAKHEIQTSAAAAAAATAAVAAAAREGNSSVGGGGDGGGGGKLPPSSSSLSSQPLPSVVLNPKNYFRGAVVTALKLLIFLVSPDGNNSTDPPTHTHFFIVHY